MAEIKARSRRKFKVCAGAGVGFIVNLQGPQSGGWGSDPNGKRDTVNTGLQLMALLAAKRSRVIIPRRIFLGVKHYLESVEVQQETYTYQPGSPRNDAMTALGLYSQMGLGAARDTPILKNGCREISRRGLQPDPFYNCLATYCLFHHADSADWKKWNESLQQSLLKSQGSDGAMGGSWKPTDYKAGGRLFTTCLNLLTLEVYYREPPLYQQRATLKDTPE